MLTSYLENFGFSKNFQPLLGAFLLSLGFVVILYYFFNPIWHTNDDIGMSMVAHGYGLAAFSSPQLIYSNVFWGYLVRSIPEINGILGYSVATLGALVLVGASLLYCAYKFQLGLQISLSIFLLVMMRPLLSPQFTINAGLLMLAAIACWNLFAYKEDKISFILGCIFAFASYLIRNQEFLLVLLIASPLIPWRMMFLNRVAKIALCVLLGSIVFVTIINHSFYQGDDWKKFRELNLVRAPYTDFKAGESLLQHPQIFSRYGYNENDIFLISNWFFIDPKIANPSSLKAMLIAMGPLHAKTNIFSNTWIAIKTIWSSNAYLLIAALLLALLHPKLRVFLCWGIFIVVVLLLSLLGRPNAGHVYIPLVCLLLVAPIFSEITGWRRHQTTTILVATALVNSMTVISETHIKEANTKQIQKNYHDFPKSPVVIWGAALPFEALYPVKASSKKIMSYKLYGLGVFTWAPFSRAYYEQKQGNGVIEKITRGESVDILGDKFLFELFEKYCKDHLDVQLRKISVHEYIQPDKKYARTLIRYQAKHA